MGNPKPNMRLIRDTAYVYILTIPTGMVKIWFAVDVDARVKSIKTSCPYEITIHKTFWMSRKCATAIEKRAHDILHTFPSRGEWFDCPVTSAEFAILTAMEDFIAFGGVNHKTIPVRYRECFYGGKLTDAKIAKVSGPDRISDGKGLIIRVGKGGTKSFFLVSNSDGKRTHLKLGSFPEMKLKQARIAAEVARSQLRQAKNYRIIREKIAAKIS